MLELINCDLRWVVVRDWQELASLRVEMMRSPFGVDQDSLRVANLDFDVITKLETKVLDFLKRNNMTEMVDRILYWGSRFMGGGFWCLCFSNR